MLRHTLREFSHQGLVNVGSEDTEDHRRTGRAKTRSSARRTLDFTRLEPRLLLSNGGQLDDFLETSPAISLPPAEVSTSGGSTAHATATMVTTATYPLSGPSGKSACRRRRAEGWISSQLATTQPCSASCRMHH
jgi:hypothetical protein